MPDIKEYRVKVTEAHSDYVWVTAASPKEAEEKAPELAQCEYERLYLSEVVAEQVI